MLTNIELNITQLAGRFAFYKMEKIVIFGSSGMTGICAVEAAVKKGKIVIAKIII